MGKTFQMRTSDDFLAKLDELRRAHASIPSRAEVVRRLVKNADADALERGERAA